MSDVRQAAELAPEDIELRVCVECGRTDRYRELAFGPYHFVDDLSRRCNGEVVTLNYRLETELARV